MPELPEVETIRLGLEQYLVGHKIEEIEIRLPRIFQGDAKKGEGGRVKGVRRFGKALVLDLESGLSFVAHVKMTGQFIYIGRDNSREVKISPKNLGTLPSKFTHIIFHLDQGATLFYNDIRQFGWIKLIPTEEVETLKFVSDLGPEPAVTSSPKATLSLKRFKELLKGKTKVKQLLMDQKKIGGIGNIYANDALWLAEINPLIEAGQLNYSQKEKLYKAILEVLKKGIKFGGASETNFVNALGEEGAYQNHFLVYGQTGKPCKRCKETIKRIVIGGRGTFFCPHCQKI